ncbi:MAG: hypothetical protein CMP10_03310 [Zetaproteobacteria bacterium]|nr:hypothetical protein [Pseudobdellovibrionaceae bacterium]
MDEQTSGSQLADRDDTADSEACAAETIGSHKDIKEWDVIVAGAGLAGVLAAAKIHDAHPEWKILLIDKDASAGGRIRTSDPSTDRWGYGLNRISKPLYDFWDQIIKMDPASADLPTMVTTEQHQFGVLSAGKIIETPVKDIFGQHGARAIAGAAAVRDWKNVEKVAERKGAVAFSKAWKGTRKDPSAIVMEHLARSFGIPDLWTCGTDMVIGRLDQHSCHYQGDWQEAIDLTLKYAEGQVTEKYNCRIAHAIKEGECWKLTTSQGEYKGNRLLVAQSPWDAIQWLPKSLCPLDLLSLTSKTKPVSILTLTEYMEQPVGLPDILVVPAESVQILVSGREVCFQVTLDYEVTLQAPSVVKAVRRLKRARSKLMKTVEGLSLKGDRISLVPVGWAQPTNFSVRKWATKISLDRINESKLAFCGDSYGGSIHGDENFIDSVLAATSALSQESVQ